MNLKHWTTAVLILLLTTTILPAQPGKGMPGKPGCGQQKAQMMGGMCGDLGDLKLSDEQRSTIMELRLEQQKNMVKMQSENAGLKGKLHLLITDDKFDAKAVDKIIARISEAKQNKMKMHVTHLRKIRDLLNDDQKVRFDQRVLSGKMDFEHHPFGGKGGCGDKPFHGKKGGRGCGPRGM